jgi:hypothetical protein
MLQLSEPPQGLIVGSSRVHKIEPSYLLAKTGIRFFNAGVNFGKTEDMLAFLRLYQQLQGCHPDPLLIGIDVESFQESPTDSQLRRHPRLAKCIRDELSGLEQFASLPDLLSWQMSKMSLRGALGLRPPPELLFIFSPDGVITYVDREQAMAEGTFDIEPYLSYDQKLYLQLYSKYDRLSLRRLGSFEKLLDEVERGKSRCVVFLTPFNPQLRTVLQQTPHFQNREAEVRNYLEGVCRAHGVWFRDFSNLDSFGGDSQEFFDGVHPTEINTRRMIEKLVSEKLLEDADVI